MKPIIGIVGRADKEKLEYNVICCFENVRKSIIKHGGIPILILPNQDIEYESLTPKEVDKLTIEEKQDLMKLVDLCDGILIPGTSKLYEYDKVIYMYAKEKDIPILGICGGMQQIAISSIKEDEIRNIIVPNNTLINHQQKDKDYVHEIKINEGTILSKIINKDKIKVNSKHKFHLENIDDLDIKVSAMSVDNLIEAIEVRNKKFILGLQWHPESMLDYDEDANKIFEYFINKCKEK